MSSVNLKKLADELKVSVSTVSRALRDSHEISSETKQKVLSLAAKLNYQPNPYASSLRNQKSLTIAVVVPEIANNFFSLAINGIEEIAYLNGYHVLIYLTHDDYNKEVSILSHLANGRVDGILMSLSSETHDHSHLEELISKEIPIVFFDRVCESISAAKVTNDDYDSGYMATEHLLKQGCTRIAYLSVSRHLSINKHRMQGYLDALKAYFAPSDPSWIVHCSNNQEENIELIKNLLGSANRPTGIFASVEKLALTTYNVCNEMSLKIPDDVKVVGFSNLESANLLNPPLTVIRQDAFHIGKAASSILFKALSRADFVLKDERIVLKSELVKRDSTV